jgi:hypothetical protein
LAARGGIDRCDGVIARGDEPHVVVRTSGYSSPTKERPPLLPGIPAQKIKDLERCAERCVGSICAQVSLSTLP